MPKLVYRRISVAAIQKDIAAIFKPALEQITGVLVRVAQPDGSLQSLSVVQRENLRDTAGDIIEAVFVRPGTRKSFADDRLTAISPYADVLNRWYAHVVYTAVKVHHDWMQKRLPDDLADWLSRNGRSLRISRETAHHNRKRARRQLVEATDNPFLQRDDENLDDYIKRIADLRLFSPNPLAEYEPMHTWVDPNGYTLSARIWNTSQEIRDRLERALMDGIQEGKGALELAKLLEQFLTPGRADLRTKKPYGKDASYYAMRLARTEIARAANQAAFIAAYMNPYVSGIDWVRSANGDPLCPICPRHATIGIDGKRIREPYGMSSANLPPGHPHCMCRVQANVTDDAATVTARLRAIVQSAQGGSLTPFVTPMQLSEFIEQLIGSPLMGFLRDLL